jgi:4-hydroxybutyryl-CoA dehydratase/vinylacetyl-CoA-Delta-isomerase
MGVKTKDEYIESIRQMKPTAYMAGEKITDIVDNPRLRPGIEATGATYELAQMDEYQDLMLTHSPLIDEPVSRFTLPPGSIEDLVARVKINRTLGNWVGTCHQRCTGLDCLSALSIVTYDIDQKHDTNYFERFTEFLKHVQKNDLTCNAGVTDVKGDRSLGPHEQEDKDMYLHIVERRDDGIVVRGAKAHQTGSLSSHEIIVLDGCDIGNIRYSKYCPTVIFDNVFVPRERVFLCGETEFAVDMVVKFSSYHRQSHGGCKSGKIDCMTGAALTMMDYSGTSKAGHLKQKIIDMIHRAETLYGCSLAASYEGAKQPSGTYFIDTVLANASKIHEGKEMAEAIRLMVDICGGYVADLPSDKDLDNPEVGHLLKKYLKGKKEVPVENRIKMYRLVEKMAMESADTISDIHGGGSPEAHRVTILRETDVEAKKKGGETAGWDR